MIFVENLYKSLSYSESVDAFLKAGFLLQQRYVVMCHSIIYVLLRNMRCISHKKGLKHSLDNYVFAVRTGTGDFLYIKGKQK